MGALEQVDELKAHAIKILLEERERIDAELKRLGHGQEMSPPKRRGRPLKRSAQATGDAMPEKRNGSDAADDLEHPDPKAAAPSA